MNKITIYEGNTVDISTTVNLENLTGYEGAFYVKKNKSDTTFLIEITGVTTTGNTLTFNLTETDTDITPGRYLYEIRITATGRVFTVNSGEFSVLDSLAIT
jgi:hypothetical protein